MPGKVDYAAYVGLWQNVPGPLSTAEDEQQAQERRRRRAVSRVLAQHGFTGD